MKPAKLSTWNSKRSAIILLWSSFTASTW